MLTRQENKKMMIVAIVIGIVLIGGLALLLIPAGNNPQDTLPSPTPTPSISSNQMPLTGPNAMNPYVDQSEIDRYQNDYNKKLTAAGGSPQPTPTYSFNYIIVPGIDKSASSSGTVQQSMLPSWLSGIFRTTAFAANSCDINSAPKTLPVYLLKQHVSQNDVTSIAAKYNLTGSVSTLEDNISAEFPFTYTVQSNDGSFMNISESSETVFVRYHQGVTPVGTDIGLIAARTRAEQMLQNVMANGVLNPVSGIYDALNNQYIFSYTLQWGNIPLVDSNLLSVTTDSICDYKGITGMNAIEVSLFRDGTISEISDSTRKVINKTDITLIPLTQAVAQYNNNLPIEPIFSASGTPSTSSGTVTIVSAELAYFDYGSDKLAQAAYIPSYITRGKINGFSVTQVFPAISIANFQKSALFKSVHTPFQSGKMQPLPSPLTVTNVQQGTCSSQTYAINGNCSVNGMVLCTIHGNARLDLNQHPQFTVQKGQNNGTCDVSKQVDIHLLKSVLPGSNACSDVTRLDQFNLGNNPLSQITILNNTIPSGLPVLCQINGQPS